MPSLLRIARHSGSIAVESTGVPAGAGATGGSGERGAGGECPVRRRSRGLGMVGRDPTGPALAQHLADDPFLDLGGPLDNRKDPGVAQDSLGRMSS